MVRHPGAARRVCALVSGGVESAALVARALERGDVVYPVYVRSDFRWESAERYWLGRLLAAIAAPRLQPLTCLRASARNILSPTHWSFGSRPVPGARSADEAVYLPGRNLVLLATASVFCARNDIGSIALGTLRGNPFPDASPVFFSRLEKALASCFERPFSIETPFRGLSKEEVLRGAGNLPWDLTFSCLSPSRSGRSPCLRCNKCEERRKAFGAAA